MSVAKQHTGGSVHCAGGKMSRLFNIIKRIVMMIVEEIIFTVQDNGRTGKPFELCDFLSAEPMVVSIAAKEVGTDIESKVVEWTDEKCVCPCFVPLL